MPETFVPLDRLLRPPLPPRAPACENAAPDADEDDERRASEDRLLRARLRLRCGLGRAYDGEGDALDDGEPHGPFAVPEVPAPGERAPLQAPLWTGVRTVDALLTLARGARVGVFGAPGTGKSSLLRAIARGARVDARIVALAGERGREAEEWIRLRDPRTTVICATSDRSAAERIRACEAGFGHAGALRAAGLHVLLVVDSLARYAAALREVALAAGEPAGRGGFPPSVFARLARTVESAGATASGSVSLVASVLDDGDERDPVSDAARSLLDGHLALSLERARSGRFPAIDVPASASRTMELIASPAHRAQAEAIRRALAWFARTADARALGMPCEAGEGARYLAAEAAIEALLVQGPQPAAPAETLARTAAAADSIGE